jgi:hypothetical protein
MTYDDERPLTPEEEVVLQRVLERGLDKLKAVATPEMLRIMREVGDDGLRTHPLMRRLVRRVAAAKQKAPDVSGDPAEQREREPSGGKKGDA